MVSISPSHKDNATDILQVMCLLITIIIAYGVVVVVVVVVVGGQGGWRKPPQGRGGSVPGPKWLRNEIACQMWVYQHIMRKLRCWTTHL